MRRLFPAFFALAVQALSCATVPPQPPPDTSPVTRGPAVADHVIVISVDGLRPDAIEPAGAMHLQGLIRRGAFCPKAETVNPSVTLPSHTSMLTGFNFPRHGVVWNNYRPGHIGHATVLSVASRAGLSTAMFFSKEKFHYLADPRWVNFIYGNPLPRLIEPEEDHTDPAWLAEEEDRLMAFETGRAYSPLRPRLWLSPPRPFGWIYDPKTEAGALSKAFAEQWPRKLYAMTFVHFREPDEAGHGYRWMSARYFDAVRKVDTAIGRIVEAVSRAGRLEKTAIIVSADHGGMKGGKNHFIPSDPVRVENMRIPWICAGPGVPAGLVIDRVVRTYDTAPTALAFLGLPPPHGIDGRAVREVFPVGAGR